MLPALLLAFGPTPLASQQLLRLGPWSGEIELGVSSQLQETDSLLGPSTLFDRQMAQQRLVARSSLSFVDQKTFTLAYGFSLGLEQSQLTTLEGEDSGDGDLRSFDLTASYLPFSPYGATLLFSRFRSETPVEFAGSRELETESLSLTVGLGMRQFPGSLSFRRSEVGTSSLFGELVRAVDQGRSSIDYNGAQRWQRHELNAGYRVENVDDRIAPSFSHTTQSATLSHRFEVLAPKLATLTSAVHLFERSGELDSSSLYIDEFLRLQHRPRVSSSYRYQVQELANFSGPPSQSQLGQIGLHHQLFQSLETNLALARTRTELPSNSHTGVDEVSLDSTYKKRIPVGAELSVRFIGRYDVRDSLFGDGQELVTEERHVARLGIPFRLDRPGVIPGTVVVTDELRTTIFEEGFDYELQVIDLFTEITSLPGGAILDSMLVLVEYRVEAPARNRSSALRDAVSVALNFGWVEPYWGYSRIRFDLLEGVPNQLLSDQYDRFTGLRFRVSRPRVDLISINELQQRDSEIQSFRSLRFGQGITYRPFRRWSVRLNLASISTDFSIPARETRIGEGRLRLRWTPRPVFSIEAFYGVRKSLDTVTDDRNFDRYGVDGRWIVGKLTVLASLEHWRHDRIRGHSVLEEFQGMTASVRVSRRFFPGRLASPTRRVKPVPWPVDLPGLAPEPEPADEDATLDSEQTSDAADATAGRETEGWA